MSNILLKFKLPTLFLKLYYQLLPMPMGCQSQQSHYAIKFLISYYNFSLQHYSYPLKFNSHGNIGKRIDLKAGFGLGPALLIYYVLKQIT